MSSVMHSSSRALISFSSCQGEHGRWYLRRCFSAQSFLNLTCHSSHLQLARALSLRSCANCAEKMVWYSTSSPSGVHSCGLVLNFRCIEKGERGGKEARELVRTLGTSP